MKILGLSTSSEVLSISLQNGKETLVRFHEKLGQKHSSHLIPYIKKLLSFTELKFSDIELVAIDVGPGSFTGLRVGVTTVKVAAKVQNYSIVGIPSLDIIAAGVNSGSWQKCVVLDARRGKVYAAFYEERDLIGDYLLVEIDELIKKVHKNVIFVGNGLRKYKQKIKQGLSKQEIKSDFAPEEKNYPDASDLINLGKNKFQLTGPEKPGQLVPMYLYSKECSIKGI